MPFCRYIPYAWRRYIACAGLYSLYCGLRYMYVDNDEVNSYSFCIHPLYIQVYIQNGIYNTCS